MSFDPDPKPNPYQSPNFSDLPPSQYGPANPELSSAILTQQRVVAILMMIQGTMSLLVGLLFVGAAVMLPQLIAADMQRNQRQGGPNLDDMRMILLATYGVMGGCGILPGILLIYAGFQNLWLRGHTLGIVALCGGALTLGTCYCLPTALALLIYGLIIYLHMTTKKAFALAKEGETFDSIMQQAIRQRYGAA